MAEQDAFARALEALGQKERTRAELESWLGERGFDPDEIAGAIERLLAAGALDDARFAHRYAADKRELRGWGPERIREALASRGIASELVEAVLDDDDRGDQVERAIQQLERRGGGLDSDRERARALAYLTRRGYDHDVAYEAVRTVRAA
jgi:regulatory protein